MKSKNIFIVLLSVLLIIILFQNTQVVAFQFLLWKITASRIFLILLGIIVGFMFGLFASKKL